MKIKASLLVCLLLIATALAGCSAQPPVRSITVYAQQNLRENFTGCAADMKQEDNVRVELVFGLNEELMAKLETQPPDVVALGSKALIEKLKREKVIDNFRLFRYEGTDYYVAKTIKSRHYAYGQRFAERVLA